MKKLFAFLIAWLSDIKSVTITIRKKIKPPCCNKAVISLLGNNT